MDRAEKSASEKAWLSVAKFGLAAGSIIETALRSCGVLAGGADNSVTINVEQLVVLPAPVPTEPAPVVIDAPKSDHQD
jgi:hypothetical protein